MSDLPKPLANPAGILDILSDIDLLYSHFTLIGEYIKNKYQSRHFNEYVPLYESAREEHRSNRIDSILDATSETEEGVENLRKELIQQRESARFWRLVSVIISLLSLALGAASLI
ncbi:hypothetical protein EXE43_08820 [Halorubrum sp. SS5]|nr:hypothetical protein EXE43_08820 [Halorubrum sp. SS5]